MYKLNLKDLKASSGNLRSNIQNNYGINVAKFNILRKKMHLSISYLEQVLSMDLSILQREDYDENEKITVSDNQLTLLCTIFEVDELYLSEPLEQHENAFARSVKDLNNYEKNRIAELRHFKKMLTNV